uniref:BHLH domain-containing protein n=1 Tax=Heterorhabditis bacteriophora TaxID=37862 RepID=A0A1I7XPY7_HETBA
MNYHHLSPSYPSFLQSPSFSENYETMSKRRRAEITGKQRTAANERERRRMNSINKGFDHLRERLPSLPHEKKLSKVDTLKCAIQYIRELQALLEQETPSPTTRQQRIIINNESDAPCLYMVSWRRTPEKYGGVHNSPRGPIVYQKEVWIPHKDYNP